MQQTLLSDIWSDIKPGDIVLKQCLNTVDEPEMIVVVGIDVLDMAVVIHYTKYKKFNRHFRSQETFNKGNMLKIHSFVEWDESWVILGHWNTVPDVKQLLKAFRKRKMIL